MQPIYFRPAHELRWMLTAGEISAVALTRMYLDRIAALDGKTGLNAVAEPDPTAMAQAEAVDRSGLTGPLAGLPLLIKDNIDVAGLHTTAGSLALADHIAEKDAPVVAALRKAGAIILGKTNMTEFANFTTQGMPGGFSSRGGQVLHAYDRTRNPSGSSSGSAVAVSAGLCAAALGTDTSFSVVGCAAEHGICGFKPPMGVLSQEGILPIAHTLDSAGILARDLQDVLLICSALREDPLPALSPIPPEALKLAINQANRKFVSQAQLTRYRRFLKKLTDAGASTDSVTQMPSPALKQIMIGEFGPDLEKYLSAHGCRLKSLREIIDFYREDPARMPYGISLLTASLEALENLDKSVYTGAMAEREQLRLSVTEELARFDACIITGPTNICHLVGFPSLSIPFCMGRDRCPRSIILYGPDEKRLLSAAMTVATFAGEIRPPVLPEI